MVIYFRKKVGKETDAVEIFADKPTVIPVTFRTFL